eukprot:scaffold544512_cov39-Prasinocladus_malaysianus.AAC.1
MADFGPACGSLGALWPVLEADNLGFDDSDQPRLMLQLAADAKGVDFVLKHLSQLGSDRL